jgi:plastocyanin
VRRSPTVAVALAAAATFASPALAADEIIRGTDALVWDKPNVAIAPGESVTWTFDGTAQAHHVAANGPAGVDPKWDTFSSPLGVPAPQASFTFNVEGTFNFYCSVHKDTMVGTVTVSKSPVPTPTPTPVPLSAQPFVNDTAAAPAPETSVALDTAKPALSALSARRVSKGVRVRFKVSEESVVNVAVRRGGRKVKSVDVAGSGSRSVIVRGLRAGRYVVRLRATDLAANRAKLRTLRITVR